ncbi:hypothetical protein [Methylobacterium sp. JK268]
MSTPATLRNRLAAAAVRLQHLAVTAYPWAVRAWHLLRLLQRLTGHPDLGDLGLDELPQPPTDHAGGIG